MLHADEAKDTTASHQAEKRNSATKQEHFLHGTPRWDKKRAPETPRPPQEDTPQGASRSGAHMAPGTPLRRERSGPTCLFLASTSTVSADGTAPAAILKSIP